MALSPLVPAQIQVSPAAVPACDHREPFQAYSIELHAAKAIRRWRIAALLAGGILVNPPAPFVSLHVAHLCSRFKGAASVPPALIRPVTSLQFGQKNCAPASHGLRPPRARDSPRPTPRIAGPRRPSPDSDRRGCNWPRCCPCPGSSLRRADRRRVSRARVS